MHRVSVSPSLCAARNSTNSVITSQVHHPVLLPKEGKAFNFLSIIVRVKLEIL